MRRGRRTQVLGATVSGFIGPWVIGWIFGTATGFKGNGLRGAMGNGVSTGTTWVCVPFACTGSCSVLRVSCSPLPDKWRARGGAVRSRHL